MSTITNIIRRPKASLAEQLSSRSVAKVDEAKSHADTADDFIRAAGESRHHSQEASRHAAALAEAARVLDEAGVTL